MATRVFICVVLATLATVALVTVTLRSTEVKGSEVVASLATEAIGILITVGFVDLLLERDHRRERGKLLAWTIINSADHAVFVWQGGSRRLDLNELIRLIELITDADPRPVATENLLLQLGDTCQGILQAQDPAIVTNSAYQSGFEALAKLSYFRESPSSVPVPNHEIQIPLLNGVKNLLRGLGVQTEPATMPNVRNIENRRDPSESAQHFRLTGERATLSGLI